MLTYSKGSAGRSPAAMPNLRKKEKGAASTIQTKLTVGKPNDRYEREADQVADHVVKQPTGTDTKVQNQANVALQTSMDPQVQRMGEEEEVQAKSNNNSQPVASAAVSAGIRSSEGGGSPLPSRVQTDMESGIGADFSKVRIHTDTRAQQMSNELNAQAFTVGNNVYFNKGKYNPESHSGKHLLAHELTHTVQQGAALQRQIQKQDNEEENPPTLDPKIAFPTTKDALKEIAKEEAGKEQIPGLDPNTPAPGPYENPAFSLFKGKTDDKGPWGKAKLAKKWGKFKLALAIKYGNLGQNSTLHGADGPTNPMVDRLPGDFADVPIDTREAMGLTSDEAAAFESKPKWKKPGLTLDLEF